MMTEYILRLLILIPMVGGLAWGSLWLWRRVQLGLPVQRSAAVRPARMVDVMPLGTSGKLAVVEFGGRELLIAVSRTQISLIAENDKGDFDA
jgi:flagellar protein FliO/FliZ